MWRRDHRLCTRVAWAVLEGGQNRLVGVSCWPHPLYVLGCRGELVQDLPGLQHRPASLLPNLSASVQDPCDDASGVSGGGSV